MPAYLSPGVYVEEVPSGNKPIQGVGTSTGAFVGLAEKGRIGEPTLIGNRTEFLDTFGGFIEGAYLAYAVDQFFVNNGTRCFVIRTCGHDALGNRLALAAHWTVTDGTNDALRIEAHSPGAWGNAVAFSIERPWSARTSGTGDHLTDIKLIGRDRGVAVGANAIGADDATILISRDGGISWTDQETGTTKQLSAVHFFDANTGWAVGAGGMILATGNAGSTWTVHPSGSAEDLVAVYFLDADTGWAVGAGGAILATSDAGASWTAQASGTTADLAAVHFVDATHGWAVGAGGTILATSDAGASWTAQASGTAADLAAVHFVDATHGWAAGAGGTIVAATDMAGTLTWGAQTSGTTADLSAVHFVDATHGWAVGTGGTIVAATDVAGTLTWGAQTSGTTVDLAAVHFVSTTEGWAVGDSGTILATSDGGAAWTAQTSGTAENLAAVHFADPTHGWAVGANGTIHATSNGGAGWALQPTGTSEALAAVHVIDANRHVAVGATGTILVTSDGGANWTLRNSGTTQNLAAVNFVDATHGWAVGDGGTILVTSDGGAAWTAQTSGTAENLGAVHFVSTTEGWAVGDGGTILAASDGGATWTARTSGTPENLAAVQFIGLTRGWAVGDGGTILATSDGGLNWNVQASGTAENLAAVHFVDSNRGWIIGENGTILTTGDGGSTWSPQESGTTSHLSAIDFLDANVGWIVGANGTVLTTTRGGAGSSSEFALDVLYKGEPVESYDRLELDPDHERSVELIVNEASKYLQVTANPNGLDPLPGQPQVALRQSLTGGDDGTATIVGSDLTGVDGLEAFNPIDDINIVAIPDSALRSVMLAGIAYCERRRDCFFVAHAPEYIDTGIEGLNFKQATGPEFAGQTAFNSSYGALYLPWLVVPDPLTRKTTLVPPVGAVAGRHSATDVRRGVHKVAAGIEDGRMRGVLGLKRQLSRAEIEVLNPNHVNALRSVEGVGHVIWGGRTLSADPEFRYISTRRLLLFIEESIEEATSWVVFEPNTPSLWATIERNVKAFLRVVWRSGALFGETEDRAFYVKCDAETNPSDSIEQGRVVTEIGVAIVKPAEFVIFRISQSRAGAEIAE